MLTCSSRVISAQMSEDLYDSGSSEQPGHMMIHVSSAAVRSPLNSSGGSLELFASRISLNLINMAVEAPSARKAKGDTFK